jgi:hypothetical protein
MTDCFVPQIAFSFYSRKAVVADFAGGQISGDGGLLLLRTVDERYRLTGSAAAALADHRDPARVQHSALLILRQRLYQIAAGYEDADDADHLRHDPVFQLLAGMLGEPLASQPTISRWENAFTGRDWVRCNDLLLDWFVRVCRGQVQRNGELVLDLDSTEDRTYGQQELSCFTRPYDHTAYHPLLVFERRTGYLLAARLRPGGGASCQGCAPILRRVLERLRREFPHIPIFLCGDAAFPIPTLLELAERYQLHYAIGRPSDKAVNRKAEHLRAKLERRWQQQHVPQRGFTSFRHRNWRACRQRRICCKGEHSLHGSTLRYVVTNLGGRAEEVFAFYQGRGDCENRIEELKNGFAADRLSCHRYLANVFRLMLHSLAYNLVVLFRLHLPESLRTAQIERLRLHIFKLGARIRRTARRVWVHFSTGWPHQTLFLQVCAAVNSS